MKLNYKRTTIVLAIALAISLLVNVRVLAGNIDSPATPGATFSYTLEDIYNRLTAGIAGTQRAFTEPASEPGATMHTLNDLMAVAPQLDSSDAATPADVISGKTFWGLGPDGAWGPQTGTGNFSRDGQRATRTVFGWDSRVLNGLHSDGNPDNGADTELAPLWQIINQYNSDTDTLADIIGVPSGYYYTTPSGTIVSSESVYPLSISDLLGRPSYDPYTGKQLTDGHSYNPAWVEGNMGAYYFNERAPIALRIRSLMSQLATMMAALP